MLLNLTGNPDWGSTFHIPLFKSAHLKFHSTETALVDCMNLENNNDSGVTDLIIILCSVGGEITFMGDGNKIDGDETDDSRVHRYRIPKLLMVRI